MDISVPKKRLSILKKTRRSRSLSPKKSPQTERRTSRRISFSGRNNIREFFTNGENKDTIWGASYEESDHLTLNSDQYSRQQQSLQVDRSKNGPIHTNEVMECSSMIATASATRFSAAAMSITSSFRRNLSTRSKVSIAVAEKENAIHPSPARVSVHEKPLNTSSAMDISGPSKPVSAIKLFATVKQKGPIASNLTCQTMDVSMDTTAVASTSNRNTISMLDENNRSPPASRRPQQSLQLNETNLNSDMSVLFPQTRRSVICKSPSKNASNINRKEQTIYFGGDTMDVTQGAGSAVNLQESRHPLSMTCIEQSVMATPAKRASNTNPYLKMFNGESSGNSVNEQETMNTEQVALNQRNITVHKCTSIGLNESSDVGLLEYPVAAPIHPVLVRTPTICKELSIDESFGFAPPACVVPVHDDKENIFVPPPQNPKIAPNMSMDEVAPSVIANNRTICEQLSIEKSFDFALPQSDSGPHDDKVNAFVKPQVCDNKENIFAPPPQNPKIAPNMSMDKAAPSVNVNNRTICEQLSIEKLFDFALPLPVSRSHDDKVNIPEKPHVHTDKENVFFLPPLTISAVKASLSDSVNTTVFNLDHDKIINSTCRSEVTPRQTIDLAGVSLDMDAAHTVETAPAIVQPLSRRETLYFNQSIETKTAQMTVRDYESIDITNENITSPAPAPPKERRVTCFQTEPIDVSLDMGAAHTVETAPAIVKPLSRRETLYFNQSIESKTAQMTAHDHKSIDITNETLASPAQAPPKKRRVTCFQTESINESFAIDNAIHPTENLALSVSRTVASPINATVHGGPMLLDAMTSEPPIDHHRNKSCRKTTVFDNESISVEITAKALPASTVASYHHLILDQSRVPSRETSTIWDPRDHYELTFIEDTAIDLIESYDSIDGDNLIQTPDLSDDDDDKRSARRPKRHTEYSSMEEESLQSVANSSASAFTQRDGNAQVSLALPLSTPSIDERYAFKKSNLLRTSPLPMSSGSQQQTTPKTPIEVREETCPARASEAIAMPSTQIDANTIEISYLKNVTVDKHPKDLNINLSGYDQFRGLSKPVNVQSAFLYRCESFKQRMNQMRETAKMDDVPDLQSQNVESPPLKFLFHNKLAELDAENAIKFKTECNAKPIGALVPIIPCILELIKNKCNQLEHWRFESLWFYRGRLILRHKVLQSYKFILDFDPHEKAIDEHINLYGKLMFTRARTMQCPIWLPLLRPLDRLRLQATIASEPIDLLQMCPSSSDLSTFDKKMDKIVRAACSKVNKIALTVIDANAVFMIDDDLVYIHYKFDDRENLRFITCNIKLPDIDRVGADNVQTIPFRTLHNDVNALSRGVEFIHEFLRNSRKYLTGQC